METTGFKEDQPKKQEEFTHENFIMGKLFGFLLMTIGSYIENGQKLHMTNASCIENRTFLYMTPNEIKK